MGTEQRNSFYKLRSKIWECVDSVWLLVFLPLRVASRRERRSLTLLFSHSGSTASKEERMRRPTTRVEQSACLLYTKAYIPSFLALSLSLSSSSSSSYHSSPQFPCIYQVDPSRPDASSRVRLGFTKREKEKLKKTRKDKRNIARGAVCSGGGYQKKEKKKKKRVERGGGNCRIKGNEDGAVSEHNNLWLLAFPPFRLSICLSACVSLAFSRSVPARKARPRIRPFLLVYRTQCLSCLTIRQQATQRRIRRLSLFLFIPLRCLRREKDWHGMIQVDDG